MSDGTAAPATEPISPSQASETPASPAAPAEPATPAASAEPATPASAAPAPEPQPATPPARNDVGSIRTAAKHEALRAAFRARNTEATAPAKAEPDPSAPPAGTPADPAAQPATPASESKPADPIVDRQGKLHSPIDGKYIPKPGEQPAEGKPTPADAAPAPATEPAAPTGARPETTDPEPGAAQVPEGWVRLEIPQGHPMAHRTRELIVPGEHKEYFQWAINNAIRHSQLTEAAQQVTALQERVLELQAHVDALTEAHDSLLTDPDIVQEIAELKHTNPKLAELVLAGLKDSHVQKASERRNALAQQQAELVETERARHLIRSAYSLAERRYPGWTPEQTRHALRTYAAMIDATGEAESLEAFQRVADALYLSDPRVREEYRRRAAEEEAARRRQAEARAAEEARRKAEEEARAREAAQLRDAATRHATKHPVGQIPGNVRTGHQSATGEPEPPDYTKMTPDQIRKNIKRQLGFARAGR